MVIKTHLRNTAVKALCESMTVKVMIQLIRELLPGYDLHKRMGFRETLSIPTANAARQIVDDICRAELFPDFVQLLVDTQEKGFKGRKYPISYLSYIIHGMKTHGYMFDPDNRMFIEDSRVQQTQNWGVLREGVDYEVTFLRFDIADNSHIVRSNPAKKVERAYQDLFSIVTSALDRRNGRIWSFQGDGGLAAFCFSRKDQQAVLAAVECLHELVLYNLGEKTISGPLAVRFAIHSGRCIYSSNTESLKKNDTVKDVVDIEHRFTRPGSCTISQKAYITLDKRIADLFTPLKEKSIHNLYNYDAALVS
ncbi:MAG TPA: hypothetical protein ENN69_00880 [Spirochaetia bacterium]|nr:hypothetical protein [Spirochaetia bacterium]